MGQKCSPGTARGIQPTKYLLCVLDTCWTAGTGAGRVGAARKGSLRTAWAVSQQEGCAISRSATGAVTTLSLGWLRQRVQKHSGRWHTPQTWLPGAVVGNGHVVVHTPGTSRSPWPARAAPSSHALLPACRSLKVNGGFSLR